MSRRLLVLALCLSLVACQRSASRTDPAAEEPESWSVTAWSEHYELFAETEPLVAGRECPSHAHFTFLPDFSALNEGSVTGILRGADGGEESFLAREPARPGIFNVVFKPAREGTYELIFRVQNEKASEDIHAGRVRVGTASAPGGSAAQDAAPQGGEPIGFLKEQQWRTAFATEWSREGAVHETLRAPAKVLAAAGGETMLTAPADGVISAARWPHPGLAVGNGAPLFVLTPRVADRGLAELQADVAEIEAEQKAAQARLARLRDLVAVEAASRRELEEAQARVAALAARLEAAQKERDTVAAVRGGSAAGAESFRVASPIAGRVAEVTVEPGQFVAAGTALARVVRPSPVWLELALQPEQAAALQATPAGLFVRRWAEDEPAQIAGADLRLVSRAPEVDPQTGTVPVILEARRSVDQLRLGSRVDVEIQLSRQRSGVVVPDSALVDDGGVEVVYVQLEGESFARREVQIAAREGAHAVVHGVAPGERIVTQGGNAIRRSALLGSGAVEGHVH